MVQTTGCINVYSEMNPWIDFVIIPYGYNYADAEKIVTNAYEDWWDDEVEIDMPIAEYIMSKLEENDIDCEIYFNSKWEEDDEDDV